MTMLLSPSRNFSLSGGRLIADHTLPQVGHFTSTIGDHFPWDEDVGVINTPDIDPSFFIDDPFKKMRQEHIKDIEEPQKVQEPQLMMTDDCFVDLAQLIQTPQDDTLTLQLQTQEEAVLHYLEAPIVCSIESSSVAIPVITSLDSTYFDTSSRSLCSSPTLTTTTSHYPSSVSPSSNAASPAPSTICSNDSHDSYFLIDDVKPDYLQPTVIDHLYTLPSTADSTKNKYMTVRKKNNAASKKSRMSKRDKQKQMEEKIAYYLDDNQKSIKAIERMEKEIQFCKDYLFKRVMQAAKK